MLAVVDFTALPATAEPARSFGHFPYAEAPADAMQPGICSGPADRNKLRIDAVADLARMRAAAKAQGVTLNPTSCFRSIASQRALFTCASAPNGTGCQNGRQISAARRATAVAPPGHSEHHTGYAIDFFPTQSDLADGECPSLQACTTQPRFAHSRSGRWLAAHAHDFGFEQSFNPGSSQGVMVEPWHYRYVGSSDAEAIFHAARSLFPPPRPGRKQ